MFLKLLVLGCWTSMDIGMSHGFFPVVQIYSNLELFGISVGIDLKQLLVRPFFAHLDRAQKNKLWYHVGPLNMPSLVHRLHRLGLKV